MRLLSRNAEALFWLARYLERGASLARVIEMQSTFGGQDQGRGWTWLLTLHRDEERFREAFEMSPANIIAFYLTDLGNGGSIRSSIHWGRENARALRPFIPLEMWVQLNTFYGWVESIDDEAISPTRLPRTCADIRAGCLAQIGTAEATLYRDEGYEFFKLGLMIERADQTSRLLDVKAAQASTGSVLKDPADVFVFWSTILRTAAAYQVYHRLQTEEVQPEQVARFLILDPNHPRTIGYCVRQIQDCFQKLRSSFHLARASAGLETSEMLMAGLQAAGEDRGLMTRLHEFNDWVQRSLMTLTADTSVNFFAATPPDEDSAQTSRKKKASQSQDQTSGQGQEQKQKQS